MTSNPRFGAPHAFAMVGSIPTSGPSTRVRAKHVGSDVTWHRSLRRGALLSVVRPLVVRTGSGRGCEVIDEGAGLHAHHFGQKVLLAAPVVAEVDHVEVPQEDTSVGDETPMATPPEALGTHDGQATGVVQQLLESFLELAGAHPVGEGSEGGLPQSEVG